MSLQKVKHENRGEQDTNPMRELEVLESDRTWNEETFLDQGEGPSERKERKSVRAAFGSRGIGSIAIPDQMRDVIEKIISGMSVYMTWKPIY